jgi:hypothetical protein
MFHVEHSAKKHVVLLKVLLSNTLHCFTTEKPYKWCGAFTQKYSSKLDMYHKGHFLQKRHVLYKHIPQGYPQLCTYLVDRCEYPKKWWVGKASRTSSLHKGVLDAGRQSLPHVVARKPKNPQRVLLFRSLLVRVGRIADYIGRYFSDSKTRHRKVFRFSRASKAVCSLTLQQTAILGADLRRE